MSEFSDAYSRGRSALICLRTLYSKRIAALEREELPDARPDLRYDQEIAEVWHHLAPWEKPCVPNVDWIKPTFFLSYDVL
jgi:hypothetical protein